MKISIPLTPEVDKNLLPPSPEGGTGGEICFPLTPEGGTGEEEIGKNLPHPSPEGGTGGGKLVEKQYFG